MRLKSVDRIVVALALLASARLADAQDQPVPNTGTVSWTQLSEKPRLLDSTRWAGLHYPAILQSANVAGDVRLTVVVGEDGLPLASSVRVEASAHDLFANSVRRAVRAWRFTPPMLDGRPVRVTVPVTASFAMPADRDAPVREIADVGQDSVGVFVRLGWEPVPKEATSARDTVNVKWAKLIVLLRLLSMSPNVDTLATTCVRWSDRTRDPLPPAMMSRIRAQYAGIVNADACPRTYWSMVQLGDSKGRPVDRRPRGHVDPVWVTVGNVEAWTPDLYLVQAHVAPPGSSSKYHCEARRDERGRWEGTCELRSTTVY